MKVTFITDLSAVRLNSLYHLVGVWVGDLDGAGHVPRHMDHGDDGFDLLHFIPLKPLQSQLVLVSCTREETILRTEHQLTQCCSYC